MKKIRIVHKTEYHYHGPVTFGQHRAMLRPREGHDLLIIKGSLVTEPESTIRWVWDFQGNSVAVINFLEPSSTLRVLSEVTVELHETNDIQCAITQEASSYPFAYPESETLEMAPFLIPTYPHDAKAIQAWLLAIYTPGEVIPTHQLLDKLNTRIFDSFKYERRDFAVFMMEAARHWGFASRFVTGYIQMNEGQHGATHAWTEIYLPGEGWRGYDPTNNKPAGLEHVAVGVARIHEKAAPLSGAWTGAADAFDRMDVSVQVVEA